MFKKMILSLIVIYVGMFFLDLDDKLYSKMNRIYQEYQGMNERIDLDLYRVSIDAKEIEVIKKNLSGITYNTQTQTLFAITNSPRKIYELNKQGEVLRTIPLHGFKDTEGITYIQEDTFAIIDERKQGFYLVNLDANTIMVHKKDVIEYFNLHIDSLKNFGYEGIAYDKEMDRFFIINEKFPSKVILIENWLKHKEKVNIVFDSKLTSLKYSMDDFSGLHFDAQTKHILFLSDESRLVAEVSIQGEKISFMDLESRFLGLKKDIPQAEGITMDEQRNIYIVSEPNLFYQFKPSKKR
jgi:uncharacterized protein YjiK